MDHHGREVLFILLHAHDADFLLTFAWTGPAGDLENHGITLFVVSVDTPGVSIARK